MTDHYVDDLCSEAVVLGATMLANQVSRLVMGRERFADDEDELMATKGMGAVYTRTSDGTLLRPPSFGQAERAEIMSRFYEPYAEAVQRQVALLLEGFGCCLITDGHSFPAAPLPHEARALRRPDICFGYDDYHVLQDIADRWAHLL